jgi:hypothetical protein
VRFDDARHDGLARQIDPSGPCRGLHLTSPADRRELAILNDERGVFGGQRLITGNQPRALEQGGACCRGRLALSRSGTRCDEKNEA